MLTAKWKISDFKNNFFDVTEKCAHKNLRYFGGYVRKVAKNSIKTAARHSKKQRSALNWRTLPGGAREAYSRPGQPPLSKTGLLKDFIFSAWDGMSKSVVIGPAKLNMGGRVPDVLEFGGVAKAQTGSGVLRHLEQVRIEARPYMWPAAQKSYGRLSYIFKQSSPVSHSFSIQQ